MYLNPYGEDPLRLMVDLINEPPQSPGELGVRCREAGLVVDVEPGEADLRTSSALGVLWCAVVDAPDHQRRAELVNDLLSRSSAYPRMTNHAGGWHLHYRDDAVGLGRGLEALVGVGTALHLTGRGMDRLGRCSVEGCDRVYADFSRTGRQRYCSTGCASRDAVRRHRARKAV